MRWITRHICRKPRNVDLGTTSSNKNKHLARSRYVDKFNSIIHSLNYREIHMGGGKYTWTNNQKHPTLEKFD